LVDSKITDLSEKATGAATDEFVINDVAGGNADKKLGMDGIRITESQVTDLGSYLTDITGEAITDLSDVSAKSGSGTTVVFNSSPTIITPTIASFANAAHDHADAAGGAQLDATTALDATGTPSSSTYLRGDNTWSTISGSGHTIQEEGTPLTQRTNLNFIGAGITATDNSGNDATDVTLSLASTDLTDTANIAYLDTANTFTETQNVVGDGSTKQITNTRYGVSGNVGPTVRFRGARGTLASPTVTLDEDLLGAINFQGYDGSAFAQSSRILGQADGDHSAGSTPGKLDFATVPNGSTTEAINLTIGQDGTADFMANTITNASDIIVGTGTPADADTGVSIFRTPLVSSTNTHGFVHEDSISPGATGTAHNSFDSKLDAIGSQDYDHLVSFQARPTFSSSGTIDRMQGLTTAFIQNGGVMTSAQHIRINDPTGSGTITTQYGLYVPTALSKATDNFAIWTANANTQRFGGTTEVVDVGTPLLRVLRFANSTATGRLDLQHARGTEASPLIIQNGDEVGDIRFKAFDGDDTGDHNADYLQCASIHAIIDGTPSTSSMPGKIIFSTTPAGSTTPVIRFDISPDGVININSNELTGIGTATITNLTEEASPTTGDFLMAYEATSGEMRKIDIGNLPTGGGSVTDSYTIPATLEVPEGTVAYPEIHTLATASAKVSGFVMPDGASASTINFKCIVPNDLHGTPAMGIRVRIMTLGAVAGPADVRLTVKTVGIADTESLDTAFTSETETTVTMPTATETLDYYAQDLTTDWAAADTIIGQISRDPTDVADDFTDDIMIIGVDLVTERTLS